MCVFLLNLDLTKKELNDSYSVKGDVLVFLLETSQLCCGQTCNLKCMMYFLVQRSPYLREA